MIPIETSLPTTNLESSVKEEERAWFYQKVTAIEEAATAIGQCTLRSRRWQPHFSTQCQESAWQAPILGPTRYVPSPVTSNLHRWVAVQNKLQVVGKCHLLRPKFRIYSIGRDVRHARLRVKMFNTECVDLDLTLDTSKGERAHR
jgi:hypothetical protein